MYLCRLKYTLDSINSKIFLSMKLRLLLLIATLCIVAYVGAVPASPKPFNVTQPDGTIITLHMIGDEYYHWKETTDNQVVVLSENGYYEYATIQNNEIVPSGVRVSNVIDNLQSKAIGTSIADREQLVNLMMNKRSLVIAHMDSLTKAEELLDPSSNSRASSTISLTEGNQKVLCILIDFPDRPFTKSKADFENMWNQTNYNAEGAYGSVKDFYAENSYGHMNVTATIVGPYRATNNSSYYATGSNVENSNVRELVREAIKAAKDDIQFENFDTNEDKFVDAIHVVFAGYAYDASPSTGLIWSHHWQLSTAVWQGLYRAKEYFITSELADGVGTKIAPIGTVCHEYGHQLGAPDYYTNNGFTGTGKWDLMASGSWNGPTGWDGKCPAHHNPYTKAYIFNWLTPMIINSSVSNTAYTLTPSHNTTSIYRINTTTNNEFFLLENKRAVPNTFNYYVPGSLGGLLIYHIHSEIEDAIEDHNVNGIHPQKCYLVCANANSNPTSTPSSYGGTGIGCAYPYNGKMFFTSNSMPSAISWAGVATGVDICFIQRNYDNIKFVVNPKINGPEILSTQSTYTITNVPSNAKIKWTYTFTPSNSHSQMHKVCKPIVFVNGDSTASVLVERGKYPAIPVDSIITGPILPGIKSGDSPITYVYFTGSAVLKATITSGGYSYTITKTITLSSSSTTELALEIEEETDDVVEDNTNLLNSALLPSYNLRHVNPISSSNAIIYIEKLLDSSNVYIPNDDNYTIEIWHHQLGLIKRVCDSTANLHLDCKDLSLGVYHIILIVDGQAVAQSKLLKL